MMANNCRTRNGERSTPIKSGGGSRSSNNSGQISLVSSLKYAFLLVAASSLAREVSAGNSRKPTVSTVREFYITTELVSCWCTAPPVIFLVSFTVRTN